MNRQVQYTPSIANRRTLNTRGASFIGAHIVNRPAWPRNRAQMAGDLRSGRLQNLTAHTDCSAQAVIMGAICNEARVVPPLNGCDQMFHLEVTGAGTANHSQASQKWTSPAQHGGNRCASSSGLRLIK
jgi:hypothetical protein